METGQIRQEQLALLIPNSGGRDQRVTWQQLGRRITASGEKTCSWKRNEKYIKRNERLHAVEHTLTKCVQGMYLVSLRKVLLSQKVVYI